MAEPGPELVAELEFVRFSLPVTAPVPVFGRLLELELDWELVDEDMLELVRVS